MFCIKFCIFIYVPGLLEIGHNLDFQCVITQYDSYDILSHLAPI